MIADMVPGLVMIAFGIYGGFLGYLSRHRPPAVHSAWWRQKKAIGYLALGSLVAGLGVLNILAAIFGWD